METFSALLALCAGNSPVPVNSPHKGQWRRALMFSLIWAWINDWVNNHEAGDLRRHRGHYAVNVMPLKLVWTGFVWFLSLPIDPNWYTINTKTNFTWKKHETWCIFSFFFKRTLSVYLLHVHIWTLNISSTLSILDIRNLDIKSTSISRYCKFHDMGRGSSQVSSLKALW